MLYIDLVNKTFNMSEKVCLATAQILLYMNILPDEIVKSCRTNSYSNISTSSASDKSDNADKKEFTKICRRLLHTPLSFASFIFMIDTRGAK